jgi:site-specific DNA recombinase
MRAVIYARYSSDLQSPSSIEDQVRVCRERVDREGWTYLNAYCDRAVSGASRLRASYQTLLEDARRGAFDVVVAEALDRLSRDQEDVAHLFKHLAFAGVQLVTLSEGKISELHIGLSGTMSALYLKQLAEKTRRGLRGRVEQGRSGGGKSYGYNVVSNSKASDTDQTGQRRVNEAEAAVICRVFKFYRDGLSPREIAKMLNREGVPRPAGGHWGPSTINGNAKRGTGLLNNELYVGRLIWNRLRYLKDPTTGKRRSKPNPEGTFVSTDVPHLRIVPQDLWEAVKARQQQITRNSRPDRNHQNFWTHQRPRYLLSGLMKCGVCGSSYTKYGQNRFACAAVRDRGTCANHLTVRGDEVEATILDSLKSRLLQPDLFEEFALEFTAETNRKRLADTESFERARRELHRINSQIARLVEAVANGADARALSDKIKELEALRPGLEAAMAGAPASQPLLHPNLSKIYRSKVEDLTKAFRDPEQGREVFEIIRSLISEIRLVPTDGVLSIELIGDLAGILTLSAPGLGQSSAASKALQIKMVAGAGFEPTTFRL